MPRHHPRLPVLLAALALVVSAPAAAHAADLYAAPGAGAGPSCTASAPCSIAAALIAARAAPGADVVNLAAGYYTETITATDPADSEVTLRGAGKRATILTAPAFDTPAVDVGSGGAGTMAIEDLAIDNPASGLFSSAIRTRLARLSLTRVRILHTYGPNGKAVAAIDADAPSSELVLDAVDVFADTEAYDPATGAITAGGTLTMRDSRVTHVTSGDTDSVLAHGDVTIQRSTIAHGEVNAGSALHFADAATAHTVTIDSSLLRGGNTSARFDVGTAATQIALRGITAAPSWDSNGNSVDLNAVAPGSAARATIENSLLLTRSVRVSGGAEATCTFTNLPPTADPSGEPDCSSALGNPGANTALSNDSLRLDKDFAPRADSPVIDSGNPIGVVAGESATDRLSRPRAAASDDTCDAGPGRRDKGAFERYRPRPRIAIMGPDRFPANTPATFTATTNAIEPFYVWVFDDETNGGGAQSTTRTFATGRARVTLEVTDRAYGCTAGLVKEVTVTKPVTAAGATRDRTAPKLTKVKLARARIARRRNAVLRFTLSEKATVTITVRRRSGKKLLKARKIVVKGKRGANRVTLSYRKLRLRRARFVVRVAARDSAGNAGKSVPRKLTIR